MYNALSALGAGGLATPWYANATAAAGYGAISKAAASHLIHIVVLVFMAFMCIVGGIIVGKIGVRMSLLVCTICYRGLSQAADKISLDFEYRRHRVYMTIYPRRSLNY